MAYEPKPATLAAYQTLRATKIADIEATYGAVLGENLFNPNGSLVTASQLGGGTGSGQALDTTDDLQEGQYNLYFTNQRAQDAVGGILTDTATIDFTYNQTTHVITADLKDLANSGVGNALVKITRDAKGRISGTSPATTDDLNEGTTNLYFNANRAKDAVGAALVDSSTIDFTYDGSARTITAALQPLTNSGAGSLKAITFDSTGRASGWVNRTITAGSTYVTVSNGDASAGNPTLDLSAATKNSLSKADTSIQSIVAGTNITVDNTDPLNPKVSATGASGAFDPTNVWAYQ